MRDRQHLAASDLLIIVHIVPQLADRRFALARVVGQDLVRTAFAVPEHDDAM